ncbi:MAG: hypothetical protein C4321_09495, partial [Chloroflexota bacterium]
MSVSVEHGVEGRVVIVTGAAGGLGRGMVTHLARNRARVVAADRSADGVDATVAALEGLGADALGVVCDVTDRSSVEEMVRRALERFGRVDALVNNAQAFRPNAPVATVEARDLDVFYESGVKGTIWCMQAVHPHMATQRWGRIVNVASATGIVGFPGFAAYNASKEAIRAVSRTAAREWGRDGIVVNVVCPGGGPRARAAAARGDAAFTAFWKDQAVGYIGDAEDDIAPVVAFLCSDACR